MEIIRFSHVVPRVFAEQGKMCSEVWQSELRFERGQRYLVEANSGRGKTTFCSYLQGYRNDYAGEIYFDETNIRQFSTSQWTTLRQRHISMLFQEMRLFGELTAMENVALKNQLTATVDDRQIAQWFEQLGLADKCKTPVAKLSQGQQQRVALIRALSQPFDFLVVDEPISHLDDDNASQMANIIEEAIKSNGAALMVTSIGRRLPIQYDKMYKL